MDIHKWINKINSMNIGENIKNNIITFFKHFSIPQYLLIIEVRDNEMTLAFNNINNYKPIALCLDIEFQSAIINKKNELKYINTSTVNMDLTAKFIRELGMMFFIRDLNHKWYYIGSVFVNFNSLSDYGFDLKELRLIGSKYATVTKETYDRIVNNEKNLLIDDVILPLWNEDNFKNKQYYTEIIYKTIKTLKSNFMFTNLIKSNIRDKIVKILDGMVLIDNFDDILKDLKFIKKQLHNIQYELYGKYLKGNLLKYLLATHTLYWNDGLVKERMKLIKNKESYFIDQLHNLIRDSVLVIKGRMDIIAIRNMSQLINLTDIPIEHYYDIETFNGFSQYMYKSAQLEETYNNLIKSPQYIKYAKNFFDAITLSIGEKAHNPLVDSLFTIVVAITINLGLNKQFIDFDKQFIKFNNQHDGEYYQKYYAKLKHEYLHHKNKN